MSVSRVLYVRADTFPGRDNIMFITAVYIGGCYTTGNKKVLAAKVRAVNPKRLVRPSDP